MLSPEETSNRLCQHPWIRIQWNLTALDGGTKYPRYAYFCVNPNPCNRSNHLQKQFCVGKATSLLRKLCPNQDHRHRHLQDHESQIQALGRDDFYGMFRRTPI